jgi:copper chaperone
MTKRTQLKVEGMTCPSCIRHVNAALAELEGVASVDVHLRDGRVLVEHDPVTVPVPQLVEALREAGYESSAADAAA